MHYHDQVPLINYNYIMSYLHFVSFNYVSFEFFPFWTLYHLQFVILHYVYFACAMFTFSFFRIFRIRIMLYLHHILFAFCEICFFSHYYPVATVLTAARVLQVKMHLNIIYNATLGKLLAIFVILGSPFHLQIM